MLVACTSPGPIFGQLRTIDELAKYSPNQNAAIAVGKGPNGIGVDSSGEKVYVANSGDNTISVIDEATNSNVR
jgi:sugar lactone lactonase YvrE